MDFTCFHHGTWEVSPGNMVDKLWIIRVWWVVNGGLAEIWGDSNFDGTVTTVTVLLTRIKKWENDGKMLNVQIKSEFSHHFPIIFPSFSHHFPIISRVFAS